MNKKIKISKLDAARRQLETVIKLYFNDVDPISIHTLVGAAHNILSDLNDKYSGRPMIISDYLIKDEMKNEFRRLINQAKNHFKHADQDSEAVIDFNPEVNEMYIYDACIKYEELTSEIVPIFRIFCGWFMSGHPELVMPNLVEHYSKVKRSYPNKFEYYSAMLSASGVLR